MNEFTIWETILIITEKAHNDFLKLFCCIVEVDYFRNFKCEFWQHSVIELLKHMANLDWR